MPPDMAISMRHSKITAKEAALLSGEINKPSWESRNEGIHERVSFEDTIWGFDLAGGSFYKTPLRVTFVKPDSRADKAGIRPGDKLKRINDIDTSTLTIQEAHDIILEAGVHIKLAVTAPEDEEDSYNCYEDPIDTAYDSDEERRKEEEKARKRQVHAKVSHFWSLQWPWVSKRRIIYRESNCFMVPSTFEEKHRDKFPIQPRLRIEDDVVLHSTNLENENEHLKGGENTNKDSNELAVNSVENGIYQEQFVPKPKDPVSISTNIKEVENNTLHLNDTHKKKSNEDQVKEKSSLNPHLIPPLNGEVDSKKDQSNKTNVTEVRALNRSLSEVPEVEEESNVQDESQDVADPIENTQINDEERKANVEENKNDEVIDEILDDKQSIHETEEDTIMNDIVNSKANEKNALSEVNKVSEVSVGNEVIEVSEISKVSEVNEESEVSEISEVSEVSAESEVTEIAAITEVTAVTEGTEVAEESSELLDER